MTFNFERGKLEFIEEDYFNKTLSLYPPINYRGEIASWLIGLQTSSAPLPLLFSALELEIEFRHLANKHIIISARMIDYSLYIFEVTDRLMPLEAPRENKPKEDISPGRDLFAIFRSK